MTTFALAPDRPRPHLADALPGGMARDIALALTGSALIAVAARIVIPLPFTPVPIALATLAVLIVGASLGPVRGSLSALIYLLAGAAGAPVFSDGQSGLMLPTFGYIVGYVFAAALVGRLAGLGADRRWSTTLGLGALGTIAMYVCGVPWLALSLDIGVGRAILLGVIPFLIGDFLKLLILGALLPSAWKLLGTTGIAAADATAGSDDTTRPDATACPDDAEGGR